MGKLRNLREDRAQVRAHTSALKSKAKTEARLAAKEVREKAREAHRVSLAEAKERAKLEKKNSKRLAKRDAKLGKRDSKRAEKAAKRTLKTEKALSKEDKKQLKRSAGVASKERKEDQKIAKAGRKHEYQMAEMELKKIDAAKFGQKDAKRWLSVAKTLTPVLVPLLYKGVSQLGAKSPGTAADARSAGIQASGPGAALAGRAVRLQQTVDRLDGERRDEKTREYCAGARARLKDLLTAIDQAETTPTSERREVHKAISGELDRINRDTLARLGVRA